MNELWQEERLNIFTKGSHGSAVSFMCVFNCLLYFGYETVKRISLKEEYKEQLRW